MKTSVLENIKVDDVTANKWKQQLNSKLEELKKETASSDGWKLHSEEDGIKRFTKDATGDPITKYKGVGRIKTKMNAQQFVRWLAAFQKDYKRRAQIFTNVQELKTVKGVKQFEPEETKSYELEWVLLESPSSLVSCREFQMLRMYVFGNDNEAFVIGMSIEHDSLGKSKNFVTSTVKITGWRVTKNKDDGYLDVVFVTQNDPGGWIPSALASKTMLEQCKIIQKYAALIQQEEK
jgi:hypothetical protein